MVLRVYLVFKVLVGDEEGVWIVVRADFVIE